MSHSTNLKRSDNRNREDKTSAGMERLTVSALGIAVVCIATRFFQFPIPLGYAHLGNCMILLFSVYFDPVTGALAAGLGSALADLLSYPEWALATLIIKSFMGWTVAVTAHGFSGRNSAVPVGNGENPCSSAGSQKRARGGIIRGTGKKETGSVHSPRTFIAALLGIVIMIAGYTISGSILYGSVATGLTQIPGLTAEGVVGIVLFYIIGAALERTGAIRKNAA